VTAGTHARRKGRRWEQALAARLRAVFADPDIRRGLQSRGGAEAPDVDVPGLWIECKHHRRVNLRAALAQAVTAAPVGRIPVAICKDDRSTPLVVLRLDDFLHLMTEPNGDDDVHA